MFCPKCGHPEVNGDECPKCGVYISKYLAFLEREKAERAAQQAAGLWDDAYKLHYMAGDKDRALELYRKIIYSYPETPEAGYALQQIAIISRHGNGPDVGGARELAVDPAVCKLIPGVVAHKYRVMPLRSTGTTLTIAVAGSSNTFARDDIKYMTGYNVETVEAPEAAVKAAIDKYYYSAQEPRNMPVSTQQKDDASRLMHCPDCGKEVSRRAAACPNCGCPIKELISSEPASHMLPSDNPVCIYECPACDSTQVEHISLARKVGKFLLFENYNSVKGKTLRCNSCRYEW